MQNPTDRTQAVESAVASLFRGLFLGTICVFAIAVWAINMEPLLAGKGNATILSVSIRLVVCDAIPVATLLAVYRGIGRNQPLEGVFLQIIRNFLWAIGGFMNPFGRQEHPPKDIMSPNDRATF